MSRRSQLRISDRERERATQELREHFAAGRITETEFSERVQASYSARTEEELHSCLPTCRVFPCPGSARPRSPSVEASYSEG